MFFSVGVSRSVCDEKELSLRSRILSSGNLEDLLPPECSQLPLVYHINDWQLYDNDDSFDDDNGDVCQTPVTFISCTQHDWTDDENFAKFVSSSELDWSNHGEVDGDLGLCCEHGFYDVAMLSGGVVSEAHLSSCLTDAEKEKIFLHPDFKLEYFMATHHRQRRVAEQLLTSDSALQMASADDDKHCELSQEPSIIMGCPQPSSKVRPDDFWIREAADTLPSDSEEADAVLQQSESASVCSYSSGGTPAKKQHNSTGNSVQSSPLCSPGRKVSDIAQQLTYEECGGDKLSESEAKTSRSLSIYDTEGISIEPGLVRRTVDLSVDVLVSSAATRLMRPVSIYETEDIELEPGLVRRTLQEIEQRSSLLILMLLESLHCWLGVKQMISHDMD